MSLGKIIDKVQCHYKCRNSVYPKSSLLRFTVPDDKVSWDIVWPEYNPITFTSSAIKDQPWADPHVSEPFFKPAWNKLDGRIDRRSHFTQYTIKNGTPLNPMGRTGLMGRGHLGRWGPNHAADPILTRWKRKCQNVIELDDATKKPILQFVGIQRRDCQEWAIPGGMVDPGETVTATLKREFLEEALNLLDADPKEKEANKKLIEEFFIDGLEIYKGYVDDPRNTDNAWMETVATNFHDENGNYTENLDLSAGDDACNVKWIDINSKLNLYASHVKFLKRLAEIRNSHW